MTITKLEEIGGRPVNIPDDKGAKLAIEDIYRTLQNLLSKQNEIIDKAVPTGLIAIWKGSIASIPSGWSLCNGSNGTPDLRDKFVIGANQDDSGTPKTNVTGSLTSSGGEATHTLTKAEMPAHTHTYDHWDSGTRAEGTGGDTTLPGSYLTSEDTGSTGSGDAHNNLPPYYSLAYIMKT